MGEDQILELVNKSLKTPKGKSLLGGELDIAGITSRIGELMQEYNIDLSTLRNLSEEDINFSLGSKLTKEQRDPRK